MTEVLAQLPWTLAAGLAVMLLAAVGLRRWGGSRAALAGAVIAWLAFGLAVVWAGTSVYEAVRLLGR